MRDQIEPAGLLDNLSSKWDMPVYSKIYQANGIGPFTTQIIVKVGSRSIDISEEGNNDDDEEGSIDDLFAVIKLRAHVVDLWAQEL